MKKDIFIDSNIASRFTNPMDPEYIKLIQWLMKCEPEEVNNAFLVVSSKLLVEYGRSNREASLGTNIHVIISKLTKEGRLNFIKNHQIKDFKKEHFKPKILRKLKCNSEDREHIPVVLLSERKYALSIDDNFIYDLINFPGFIVRAEKRPENLEYAE